MLVYGGDGATRTHISLQITGVQDRTDTNFWLRLQYGTPNENRTRISALKGRRPIPLVDESIVARVRLELTCMGLYGPLFFMLNYLAIWWGKKDLNFQHPKTPDLQSGTLPITLYYPNILGF